MATDTEPLWLIPFEAGYGGAERAHSAGFARSPTTGVVARRDESGEQWIGTPKGDPQ
jgi:hypothetical protein